MKIHPMSVRLCQHCGTIRTKTKPLNKLSLTNIKKTKTIADGLYCVQSVLIQQ